MTVVLALLTLVILMIAMQFIHSVSFALFAIAVALALTEVVRWWTSQRDDK